MGVPLCRRERGLPEPILLETMLELRLHLLHVGQELSRLIFQCLRIQRPTELASELGRRIRITLRRVDLAP